MAEYLDNADTMVLPHAGWAYLSSDISWTAYGAYLLLALSPTKELDLADRLSADADVE